MHQLDIREQVRLPFLRCVELVMNGIQFRLFRASITVVIVALAVAFLVTMLSSTLISREVARDVEQQTHPRKQLLFWVNSLTLPLSEDALRANLLLGVPQRMQELRQWSGLSDADMEQLRAIAAEEKTYLGWFQQLSRAELRRLAGPDGANALFRTLANDQNWTRFADAMERMPRQFPASPEEFKRFLSRYQATEGKRARIRQGHAAALAGVRAELGEKSVIEAFAEPGNTLASQLAAHGFLIAQDEINLLQEEARFHRDTVQLEQILQTSALRQRLVPIVKIQPQDIQPIDLFRHTRTKKGAIWLKQAMRQLGKPLDFTPERVAAISAHNVRKTRLAEVEAEASLLQAEAGPGGFSQRLLWLLGVSFLVCVVGIANAMLMSVTERFREIATMKCLGATDGFVMGNFLLESCMQGLAGGLVGAAAGAILGFLKALGAFGWIAASNIPYGTITLLGLAAAAGGVLLSALAAVYPAWVAARLAPLEAMRVE